LQKTNGAVFNVGQGSNPSPIVIVGPARWGGAFTSINLASDASKGANSITVASTSGLSPGQIVLLDERSGAQWMPDAAGAGQIWASPDYRVVYQLHNPPQQFIDDPITLPVNCTNDQSALSWFSRCDRPQSEIKEIASISGNTITFTSPVHISYRTSHTAQLSYYNYTHVKYAGIEGFTVKGGDDGQLRFEWAAYSWAKNIENTVWVGEGFAIDNSFRIEIRDSYIHDAAVSQPGGGAYAISFANGTAEVLVENNISMLTNKVMVARSSGAGSVFGYNYVDDGFINYSPQWQEVGLNASHMVGSHHVLFEGNYGFNFDSDDTHGNSTYHTVFRNSLTSVRKPYVNPADGKTYTDSVGSGNGPLRAAGPCCTRTI